jgi:pilus assembly protein CpaE
MLVACAGDSDNALSFVQGISRHYPDRPIIVLRWGSPNGFVSRAFAAGAEDIVNLPESNGQALSAAERERSTADVLLALEKTLARRSRVRTVAPAQGQMITVLGPKGGAGKTLTSCSVAITLAEAGKRVVLVDLDLQFGDVALALGVPPGDTIYDLVQSGGSLDAEKLSAYLAEHESGVRVLMAPARPDQASAIDMDFLRTVFDLLRESEDFVVVDTAPGFTPEVIASIDASTEICMVGMLDSLSLKNTKIGLETLDLMGVSRQKIKLVLNRADSRVGITREDVQAVTGRPPDVLVPSHRDIPRSVNEARPIVRSQPRSDAARALRSLGSSYIGAPVRVSTRRRLFGRGGNAAL